MLEFLNKSFESLKSSGKSISKMVLAETITETASQRVRPIMMTTCSTVAGLLPIMFITETGSEVMHRVAAPMIGGLISSTVLTLIVIPVVFYIWLRYSLLRNYSWSDPD